MEVAGEDGHVAEMVVGDDEVAKGDGKVMGELGKVEAAEIERRFRIPFSFPFLEFLLDNKRIGIGTSRGLGGALLQGAEPCRGRGRRSRCCSGVHF